MASGRPDYNRGVIPVMPVYGDKQSPLLNVSTKTVTAPIVGQFDVYTVPANNVLYLTAIRLACNLPGFSFYSIDFGGGNTLAQYFDQEMVIDFPSAIPYQFGAGTQLAGLITNTETMARIYQQVLVGYLEDLT